MGFLPDKVSLYVSSAKLDSDLARALRLGNARPRPFHDGVYLIECDKSKLRELSTAWASLLPNRDLDMVRCSIYPSQVQPSVGDLMHSQTLRQLIDRVEGQWLEDLLISGRLITYFQPIVRTDDPCCVFAHECLIRGQEENGDLIPPPKLFATARATDRIARLDHASRMSAIETAVKKQVSSRIFINFHPRFLDESGKYLYSTFAAIFRSEIPTDRFVFEVVESDEITDVSGLMRTVDYCREAGCQIALDDVGTGYNSLYLMSAIKPDFIKLDRDIIRDAHSDPYKGRIAATLLELANELNIDTVVEGIEDEASWRWALDNHAAYGQGFFFARPNPEPLHSNNQHVFI